MDEYAYLMKFAERLNSEKRWNGVITDIRQMRLEAVDSDGGWLDGKPFENAPLDGRIHFDLHRTFSYLDLAQILDKHILSDFDFPPITVEELTEIATL